MNNFSDLLAIEPRIQITVDLTPLCSNGNPWCVLRVNGENKFADWLQHQFSFSMQLPLLDPICVEITLAKKVYETHKDTGIIIDQINIDGFNIVPRWTGCATYQNDHDHRFPTSYLGFNGTWALDIKEPFYRWRHHVLGQGWLLNPIESNHLMQERQNR